MLLSRLMTRNSIEILQVSFDWLVPIRSTYKRWCYGLPNAMPNNAYNLCMIQISMSAVEVLEAEPLGGAMECVICRDRVQMYAEKLRALLHALCRVQITRNHGQDE